VESTSLALAGSTYGTADCCTGARPSGERDERRCRETYAAAVREHLGLQLTPAKRPIEVLVVEAEKDQQK
jgi:uncharacterized protein (TIGR03435 family)